MELAGTCFGVASSLALVGAKLYCVLQEIESAENSLEFLIQNVKSIELQLSTVQEYVPRAELSASQKTRCEHHIRDIELRINKLVNLLDSIVGRLTDKTVSKKVKQKLALVNGEIPSLRDQIDKIGQNLSAVREEMLIAIALDERTERRKATSLVSKQLDLIEANTTGSDASKIRKQYKTSARMLIMDDFCELPPYTPNLSPPQKSPSTVFGSHVGPFAYSAPYPEKDIMPSLSSSSLSSPPLSSPSLSDRSFSSSSLASPSPLSPSISVISELEAPVVPLRSIPELVGSPPPVPQKPTYIHYQQSNRPQWANSWEY
ncbi:hypothetical protein H072_1152 [Dactylellina haptotyla CBS 200.50]|uniref:Fungal N-terminal domain-containing protein n=1 Tax=Dactylellina haptotyla (strain CBS 200.50) TaxID=1284197 RepID=S8AV74_DACHA|nr:hypothetical protein H072_1152 [Dactylellina haptotyla CBS 200.50]